MKRKLRASPNRYSFCTNGGMAPGGQVSDRDPLRAAENGESRATDATRPKAGSKEYLIQLEQWRSIKVLESNKFTGIAIVFFAGFLMSFFSPAFNLATNDQWHFLKDGVPHLVVYTAFFYFSISSFVIGVGFDIWFLYHPIAGMEVSPFTAYLKDWKGRHWALLAGLLCGFGNDLEFMGGQAAGYAAADAVEALPLVSTFWAILLLKEYWRSSKKTTFCLCPYVHGRRRGSIAHGFSRSEEHEVIGHTILLSLVLVCNSNCHKAKKFREQGMQGP